MTWTPLICFTAIVAVFVVGEILSNLTKGNISSMVFASFIALALFWSGIFPKDIAPTSVLPSIIGTWGVAILLVNMGTSIDLENLLAEWKTVVVAVLGLVGLAILAFTVGIAVFGREYALTAACPISGGTIAYQIVSEAANNAGKPELAGFAALCLSLQGIIGMPIATLGLKKELAAQHKNGTFSEGYVSDKKRMKLPETNLFKDPSKKLNTGTFMFFKLGFAAVIAYLLSTKVLTFINVNIMYLLVGVILRKINFLQKNTLQTAGGYGILTISLYALVFNGFASVSIEGFKAMMFPLIGMLVMGAAGIIILSIIGGKIVGYPTHLAISLGVTALFGYPGTEILSREAVNSMDEFSDSEKAKALDYIMPKMIVGGFTTVTIASVVFAGVVAPMIF